MPVRPPDPPVAWLSHVYRPSHYEVHAYAELIAASEGMPRECARAYEREAELQLWVWRSEQRQRPPQRGRTRRRAA